MLERDGRIICKRTGMDTFTERNVELDGIDVSESECLQTWSRGVRRAAQSLSTAPRFAIA
jgi:hypothetical protein